MPGLIDDPVLEYLFDQVDALAPTRSAIRSAIPKKGADKPVETRHEMASMTLVAGMVGFPVLCSIWLLPDTAVMVGFAIAPIVALLNFVCLPKGVW